jgi:hypothetical protein
MNNNQQETGADKWDVDDNCLHWNWAGEDSANDEEEGLLVMTIATMRLDGLCWVTLQMWDDGHRNNDRGGGRRDSGHRGGWPLPLPLL